MPPQSVIAKKSVVAFLLILNVLVLLGQVWPEGAPPFAGVVNILFLLLSLVYFSLQVFRKETPF